MPCVFKKLYKYKEEKKKQKMTLISYMNVFQHRVKSHVKFLDKFNDQLRE